MTSATSPRTRLGVALLALVLATVLVSVLLPNTTLAWMRENWSWFNRPMLWIEDSRSMFNLVHAILFALLGMATALALPRWRAGRVLLALLLLGLLTEGLQLLVPGRHARLSDVAVDVVAGLLGWMLARIVVR